MFDNYGDACLMDESYVFHTSTSTFRNPIFDTQIVDDDDEEDDDNSNDCRCSYDDEQGGPVDVEAPMSQFYQLDSSNKAACTGPAAANGDAGLQNNCTNNARFSLYQSDLSQRWQDFCDSLAFSIKGKLFIMGFNFKRRLRAMRKYIDKNVPWILPNILGHHHKHHQDCMRRTTTRTSKSTRSNRKQVYCSPVYKNNENVYNLNNTGSNSMGQQEQAIDLGCFHFPEPNSAKSLGAQQECLLNRLERIKRDSQKLAQMQPTLEQQDENEMDYIDHEDDYYEHGSDDYNGGRANDYQAVYSRRYRASYATRPELGEPYAKEPNQTVSVSASTSASASASASTSTSNSGEVKFGQSLAGGTVIDQAKLAKASAKTTISSVGGKSSRGGRWISRGGKHIRDTALAFTSSKKSCIVCYERAPNIVTLPCKHSDICSDCFIEIIFLAVKHSQYPLRCVLCRQKVERIRCSRRLLLSVIEKKRSKRC